MTRRSLIHCRAIFVVPILLSAACAATETSSPPPPVDPQDTTPEPSLALPESAAVLPLVPKGETSPGTAEIIDELLLSALQKAIGSQMKLIGRSDITALLTHEQNEQVLGCEEADCAANLAGALGTETIISGSVSKLGDRHVVTLAWIDRAKAEVFRRAKRDLGDRPESFDVGVYKTVEQLLRESAAPTRLEKPKTIAGGGRLSADEILKGLDGGREAIDGCRERWLTETDPSGQIELRFFVQSDGTVGRVELKSTSFNNPKLESCVASAVQSLQFPKPRGNGMVEVNYPFQL